MKTTKLKLYKVGFTPNPCDTPAISRSVYILAYSEDQARKFLRDWMVNVKKCIYLYEGCDYIKTNSKEWKRAMGSYSIDERWEKQQSVIYGRK